LILIFWCFKAAFNNIAKVYQLLSQGRRFSPGNPASSTTKTGRHDIAEILLKAALKHQKIKINILIMIKGKPDSPERTSDPGKATGKL
jgi:hypothetical protein